MNKGQGLVEYVLILILVGVVVLVMLAILQPIVAGIFRTEPPKWTDVWEEVPAPPGSTQKCYKQKDRLTIYELHCVDQ